MISWMQKHNRYLVWTIWIATIAFIGAGFVGWGSYTYGSKASAIAKVGEIEIPKSKLDVAYGNIYNQYNQMMQGRLDEQKAKELGLVQRAFATLETQAKVLNFAKDLGIIVSDKEIAGKLQSIQAFQKDGIFDKTIYEGYLKSQRMKAKVFESMLKDELVIEKTLNLIRTPNFPLEIETVGGALNVADKISYKVLTPQDTNVTLDETKVKNFWEARKESYMTPKTYSLSIVWTPSKTADVTEEELKAYFDTNSFNYIDNNGKPLSFEEAKHSVAKDLKLNKTKKTAQKNYIEFKKGNIKSSETITLSVNDPRLSQELWNEIQSGNVGDILKPKVVEDKYATVKIDNISEPKVMTYEQAKDQAISAYIAQAQQEALLTLAKTTLENFKDANATVSDFVTLETLDNLKPLNTQESLQFLQKLFTSSKEKGMINISDKVIVYDILEQKILPLDANKTEAAKKSADQIKQSTFETNLIKMLDKKYPTEVYMGGLTN